MEAINSIIDNNTGEIKCVVYEGDEIKITRKNTKSLLDNTVVINNNENFVKVYVSILRDLINESLTSAEFQVILVCLEHLNYYTGAIAYYNNGNFLTPNEITKISKLSKSSVIRAINRLVKLEILHKGKTGSDYQLYANPFIFMKGSRVNKTLKVMFCHSKWGTKIGNKDIKRNRHPKKVPQSLIK